MVSNLDGQRMQANELRAIASLRSIMNAQVAHYGSKGSFAPTLAALGPGGTDLLPASLAGGTSAGYKLTVTVAQDGKAFTATAMPEKFGESGRRSFLIDEGGTLRENRGPEAPTAQSPLVQ